MATNLADNLNVLVPKDEDCGPKMRALTQLQRAFVICWFHFGDRRRAYAAAGYACPNVNTVDVGAYQVWHNPRVQAALQEYARTSLDSMVPAAMAGMETILADPNHKDYGKVIGMVLDRTGFHATTMQITTKRDDPDDKIGKLTKLVKLAEKLGVDPKTLLGNASDATEEDMKTIHGIIVDRGREGLEGLI